MGPKTFSLLNSTLTVSTPTRATLPANTFPSIFSAIYVEKPYFCGSLVLTNADPRNDPQTFCKSKFRFHTRLPPPHPPPLLASLNNSMRCSSAFRHPVTPFCTCIPILHGQKFLCLCLCQPVWQNTLENHGPRHSPCGRFITDRFLEPRSNDAFLIWSPDRGQKKKGHSNTNWTDI